MAGISQVIRWRQGRALVTPKRAKLQKAANTQRQTPQGGDSGSASDSAKVSLASSTTSNASSAATYTDRVKRPKVRSLIDAAKTARNRSTTTTTTSTGSGSEAAPVADAHVREALAHFAKVAQAGRGSGDATPAQTPPVAAASQVGIEMDWSVSSDAEEVVQPEADKLAEAARADAEAAQAQKTDSDSAEADRADADRAAKADADRARTERADQERAERDRAQAKAGSARNFAANSTHGLAASHAAAAAARADAAPPQDLAAGEGEAAEDEVAAAAEPTEATADSAEPAPKAQDADPSKATDASSAEALGRSLQAQRWLLGGASAPPATGLRAFEPVGTATAASLAAATAHAASGTADSTTGKPDTPTAYASHEARRLWETGADPAHPSDAPHFDLRS